MAGLVCLLPLVFVFFYARNLSNWGKKDFKAKYGSLLEGTNLKFKERKWVVLIIPSAYFLRRIAIVLTLVIWQELFWVQVAV